MIFVPTKQRADQSPKRQRGVTTQAGDKPVAHARASDQRSTFAHGQSDAACLAASPQPRPASSLPPEFDHPPCQCQTNAA